jgi:hypothetical protein
MAILVKCGESHAYNFYTSPSIADEDRAAAEKAEGEQVSAAYDHATQEVERLAADASMDDIPF